MGGGGGDKQTGIPTITRLIGAAYWSISTTEIMIIVIRNNCNKHACAVFRKHALFARY